MYLPPRPDGTAGKHAVWVRKDNSDASGIANRDRLLSSAPPSVPSTDWAPSQHQVNPRTGGPESRDGITKLGPHWNFHNSPRNHDTHRGPSHSALNSTRSVGLRNLPAAPSVAQAPPSRPLLERVSSFTTGHNGSIRQSQPSLAARMSPVRPMRNIHVSHGLLKRTPLSFATGPATRLGPGDVDGPPKLTGSNQVPVLNLNPGIMVISTAARAGYPGSGGV
ncbi:hypothetical protein M407DRAFT_17442 [Tulasnella calospora MUT 4182]|uniref:Uncharacterized protein n=1 Tax=Tulasnella calospora MUT 4182 TaxID=1051891 RepID=A0A0C3QVX9_9AGAM|nr:hypothetical protein M407DRAFT_17442 [Tulasnella calospora MUT 4182]